MSDTRERARAYRERVRDNYVLRIVGAGLATMAEYDEPAIMAEFAASETALARKWISVKDEMPKPVDGIGGWFLVTNGKRCDVAKCLRGETFMGHALQFAEITHWMRLPELPERNLAETGG